MAKLRTVEAEPVRGFEFRGRTIFLSHCGDYDKKDIERAKQDCYDFGVGLNMIVQELSQRNIIVPAWRGLH